MKKTNKKKIIVAAMGIPVRKGPEYLLSRRHAPGISAWHNHWQVVGGGLEFGETPEETLVREFNEELRVKPTIIFSQPIVKTSIWYGHETATNHDAQIILITYIVDIGNQPIDISGDDETNKVGWYQLNEIRNLKHLPMTIEITKEADSIIKSHRMLQSLG